MSPGQLFLQGDAVTQGVALLLLAMSVACWVAILWKAWLLRRAGGDTARAIAAFWQSPDLIVAGQRLPAFDREGLVQPLVEATRLADTGLLDAVGPPEVRLTRQLREALTGIQARLRQGQVLLATVGSTAPFVGLLGTVWGIYRALIGMADAGQVSIDRIAGPVGESLVMTAAGLAVALPAVLAYNVYGRIIASQEAALEGFARDLRDLHAGRVVSTD
ncbi:MAG: MotA/TolQ/ExbB proton channel family protein [Rhodoferax sp.]|nr:MotA/TolQ/ExbB proton channel family protein [Rhodoferax sp.]